MTIPFITSNYISTYPTTFGSFTPFYSAAKMPSIFTQYPAASYITAPKIASVLTVSAYSFKLQSYLNLLANSVKNMYASVRSRFSNVYTSVKQKAKQVTRYIINKGKVALHKIEELGLKFTSQKHRQRWDMLDGNLQSRLEKLVEYAKSKGITIYINSSWRTEAEQQDLLRKGKPAAKKGSRHLSGRAVDIRVSGDKNKNLALLGKYWRDNLGGNWGGDFRTPIREPWHFEVA